MIGLGDAPEVATAGRIGCGVCVALKTRVKVALGTGDDVKVGRGVGRIGSSVAPHPDDKATIPTTPTKRIADVHLPIIAPQCRQYARLSESLLPRIQTNSGQKHILPAQLTVSG